MPNMESTQEPRLQAFTREAPGREARSRDIVVLGSTGSIGTQAADIVRRNPDRFRIAGLAAGGGNPALLASQALEFGAEVVAVASEASVDELRRALQAQAGQVGQARQRAPGAGGGPGATAAPGRTPPLPKILVGPDAIAEVAAWPCDVVLNGVTGAVGLAATLAAIDAGRVLALANKESLIMGGPLVAGRAVPGQIVPGGLRALGARPVPARRSRRRGAAADRDRQRRAVPAPQPRRTRRRHARSRRSPTPPGTWAR